MRWQWFSAVCKLAIAIMGFSVALTLDADEPTPAAVADLATLSKRVTELERCQWQAAPVPPAQKMTGGE